MDNGCPPDFQALLQPLSLLGQDRVSQEMTNSLSSGCYCVCRYVSGNFLCGLSVGLSGS